MGMNAPESRTRDLEEKKLGLAAKARLIEILGDGEFYSSISWCRKIW